MKRLLTILFLLCIIGAVEGQKVTTYAGKSQTSGTISGGESLTTVRFNKPWGMATDAKGNVFITNEGSHAIFMLNKSDGKFYVRAGKQNSAGYVDNYGINAEFDQPKGIAVGSKIYVADAGNHVIRQIDLFSSIATAQQVTLLAGKKGSNGYQDGTGSGAQFDTPTDVAVDSKGNIYVADQGNHCIRMITTSGVVTTFAGQPGSSGSANGDKDSKAKFNYPTGLFIDGNDNIYVADKNNNCIRFINRSTSEVTTVFKDLYTPEQVFVDSYGTIIASGACQIRGLHGTDTLIVGNHFRNCGFKNASDTNALLNSARAIMQISSTEYIFCDRDNHILRKIEIDPCSAVKANISVSGKLKFCDGDSVMLSASNLYSNTWTWSGGTSGKDKITAKATGRYSLKISATVGASTCTDTSSVFVKVNQNPTPAITYAGNLSFCPGDQIILSADANYNSYLWSTSEKTKSITVNSALKVSLMVTDANGCSGTSAELTTSVFKTNKPIISPDGPTEFCSGNSVVLDAGSGFSQYDWSNKATGETTTIKTSGKYNVTTTDTNGCKTTSDDISVTVYPLPQKPDITSKNDSVYTSASAVQYIWFFEGSELSKTTDPYIIAKNSGKYSVTVVDDKGCENSSDQANVIITSVNVQPTAKPSIYPNPATTELKVRNTGSFSYEIIDLTGKTRKYGKSLRVIDISSLAQGTYFIRITTEHNSTIQKFIIAK
ncbi:T9SS type A sorting domain-containing protein [bacterium]|nr:T9SS type A sorting domain-containing protein [bacterium]